MPKHDRHGRSGLFGLGLGALSFGAVASAIAGSHKILETAVQLRHLWDVGEDNMVFIRIMERVKLDLREVERLLAVHSVKEAVRTRMPRAKVEWIEESMRSVRVALEKTAHFTKRVKKDTDRGVWVGLRNRIWFRAEEFEKLNLHTLELARCHDGLLSVLGLLSSLESGGARSSGSSTTRTYDGMDEKEFGGRRYESVGLGETVRDERREIDYRLQRDDYDDDGDIVYTKLGDGPGYNAEIVLDRFDGEQLEAQFAGSRRFSGDDEYRNRSGEHITAVEVDRVVERDDGERVKSHYVEKHADDHERDREHHGHWRHVHKHYHHEHDHHGGGDERHIDVKKRAEVRRHHGQDHVTKVEIDGYETRDDGRRVEAHYTEERDDDRRSSSSSHRRRGHHGEEERYIDVERRAEIRRRD